MNQTQVDSDFWHGKRVLVTGHTGFKGAWLSLWLKTMGAEVLGYALPPQKAESLYDQLGLEQQLDSRLGDIADLDLLRQTISDFKPECVFHLAAQALVRYSYSNPLETLQTNVMGTAHVLEAIKSIDSVRSALIVTSDKCYDNKEWVWGYRENDPMGGHDPYSASKGCAELVVSSFRNSYFLDQGNEPKVGIATARAGNVIGGGDVADDRLIPDFIRAIKGRSVLEVRNPNAIRPWQHVLESLSGYLVLSKALYEHPEAYSQAWNFGPQAGDAKPVSAVLEQFSRKWGEGASYQMDEARHPHEAEYLKLDCSKANLKLGWSPRWCLEQAIDRTVDWYRSVERGESALSVSERQISQYMSL